MNRTRFPLIIMGLIALVGVLIGRLIYLQWIQYDVLTALAHNQIQKTQKISAFRGGIYDRNDVPLAISKQVYSAYAVPVKIQDPSEWAKRIAPCIQMPVHVVLNSVKPNTSFVWLKRQLTDTQLQALRTLNDPAIGFLPEYKRVYPHGSLAAHVVGFTGMDSQGLSGVEYYYGSALSGQPGKQVLESDPLGVPIPLGKTTVIQPALDGNDVQLTLDLTLQYFTEKYLKEGIERMGGIHGQAVVMDPHTGEVLAMASYPTFDLNQWQTDAAMTYGNPVVTDVYEPGSVFKLITVASALEEGVVTAGTVLEVPETLTIASDVIKEAHERNAGETDQKSIEDIVKDSLNVGVSLVSQDLGNEKFFRYIQHFGFGKSTAVGLPGETGGLVRPFTDWRAVDTATIAFGQGIGVSSMQLATAVSAIVNGGILVRPRIIQSVKTDTTHKLARGIRRNRILTQDTANEMRSMMESVVQSGTAAHLKIPGYRIGGKTGTANKPSPTGGYYADRYVASFVGFLDTPSLVLLVMVDSPEKSIWGSTVAGPIFRRIALSAIDYYGASPIH
jgi:cell division protein FtsI (penicillin-binding protein 3)